MAQNINNLPVGSKIKFGSIYSNPIVWLVAGKNHTGYPSNSITLVTEKIIKIMAFDAKEPSNSNGDRQNYGNNRYLHSNIRQWLNSDKAGGAWYEAQHNADAPPNSGAVSYNPYTSLPGFLNAFTADEKNAILNTTLTVAKNTVTDGGGSETVNDGVFLLSNTEVGLANENSIAEGSLLSLFSTSSNRITQPTAAAVSNSDYTSGSLSASQAWYWWLRTPRADDSRSVRRVSADGSLSNNNAYNGGDGLRPALNLPSDLLISDTADSDGCYTVIYNRPPTTPTNLNVPTTVMGGESLTVTWGTSTDPDGNLAGYRLERRYNGGSWVQVHEGGTGIRTFNDSITFGWTSVQYRVRAYDTAGATSEYRTSETRTVTNNRDPVISGSDTDLGSFAASSPSYNYTVTDEDGHAVTVVEKLDGTTLRTFTPTLGAANTITFAPEVWLKILNGLHTLTIKATDPQGAEANRAVTFTKAVTQISFETDALAADDMPTKAIVNIRGSFPPGSNLTIEICNNANDTSPTWEDITAKVLSAQKHFFTNTTKTAAEWGVALRVVLDRGTAAETCYIQSIGGNFG